jgi:hypothetical protein
MALTSCLLHTSYLLLGFSPNSTPAARFCRWVISLSFFSDTVYNYSNRLINPKTQFLKSKLEMPTFESDYPFCGNPRCELHVRAGRYGFVTRPGTTVPRCMPWIHKV